MLHNTFNKTAVKFRTLRVELLVLLFATSVFFLTACSISVKEYEGVTPNLDLQEYFHGELSAWGIFQSRSGEVKRHFKVRLIASWDKNICTLEEYFTFNDGEKQKRIWTITKIDEHHYIGTAGDVVGEAQGIAYGNALNWQYTLELPVDENIYKVKFDDWMYLVDENTLINRAVVRKFGFRVGEVTIFFRKGSN